MRIMNVVSFSLSRQIDTNRIRKLLEYKILNCVKEDIKEKSFTFLFVRCEIIIVNSLKLFGPLICYLQFSLRFQLTDEFYKFSM